MLFGQKRQVLSKNMIVLPISLHDNFWNFWAQKVDKYERMKQKSLNIFWTLKI
jgi:hypothetical protein